MPTTEQIVDEAAAKYRNWGKWGANDQLGTLNYITAEKVIHAARLVRTGKVISMALPFDSNGPQTGGFNRFNPIHTMIATGSDHAQNLTQFPHGLGYADDMITMPLQCGTQWDALSHVYDRGKMWNGYPAAEVTSRGAQRNGIEHFRDRVVSRGVLLDVARFKGVGWLADGYPVSEADVTGCAQAQKVAITPGDVVLVRTGQIGRCLKQGWGTYAGGDAPGMSFYTADWLYRSQIAAIATDTWGFEVRPNELPNGFQPLHQIVIPNMGLLVGEIFALEELSEDCARDGIYEFMFVAPPLPVTGGVGSPVNPQAIK